MKKLAFLILIFSPSSHGEVVPFQAVYDVEIRAGVKARAQATMALSQGPNANEYRYQSQTKAKGFARMLRSKPISEYSEFQITPQGLKPLAYEFKDGSKKNKRGESAQFNWGQNKVQAMYKGENHTLNLKPGMLDRNLIPLLMMHHCPKTPDAAEVITRGGLRQYNFRTLGTEVLDTPLGKVQTVKVKQWRDGSSRSTVSWLSPKHQCLFLQVHQFKNDKRVGQLTIRSLSGI